MRGRGGGTVYLNPPIPAEMPLTYVLAPFPISPPPPPPSLNRIPSQLFFRANCLRYDREEDADLKLGGEQIFFLEKVRIFAPNKHSPKKIRLELEESLLYVFLPLPMKLKFCSAPTTSCYETEGKNHSLHREEEKGGATKLSVGGCCF